MDLYEITAIHMQYDNVHNRTKHSLIRLLVISLVRKDKTRSGFTGLIGSFLNSALFFYTTNYMFLSLF